MALRLCLTPLALSFLLANASTSSTTQEATQEPTTTSEVCQTVGSEGVGAGVACVFPFIYKGITYKECTAVDRNTGWCATEVDSDDNYVDNKWGDCNSVCQADACAKYGGIPHKDGKTCCKSTCGEYCGADDCDKGGTKSCCASSIPDSKHCSDKQAAPCTQADICAKYDGTLHEDGYKCCDDKCGNYCGADNCDKGPGGANACCGSKITDTMCSDERDAPCTIKAADPTPDPSDPSGFIAGSIREIASMSLPVVIAALVL